MTQLEEEILQAIEELGEDAYSVPIRRKVHELLNKRWWQRTSTSTIVLALYDMEKRGWIGSYQMAHEYGWAFRLVYRRNSKYRRHFYINRNITFQPNKFEPEQQTGEQ